MTQAPERIYAWPGDDRGWYAGGCSNEPTMCFEDVEYFRADTVRAMLAASWDKGFIEGNRYMSTEMPYNHDNPYRKETGHDE